MENTENSLVLWRVANWPYKVGLVQSLFSEWGQPQGEQVSSLTNHTHCLAFLQTKVKDQVVSYPPEIFMRQRENQQGRHTQCHWSVFWGQRYLRSWHTSKHGNAYTSVPSKKVTKHNACNSKWGFSSGAAARRTSGDYLAFSEHMPKMSVHTLPEFQHPAAHQWTLLRLHQVPFTLWIRDFGWKLI